MNLFFRNLALIPTGFFLDIGLLKTLDTRILAWKCFFNRPFQEIKNGR
jgi:hypothetical protein